MSIDIYIYIHIHKKYTHIYIYIRVYNSKAFLIPFALSLSLKTEHFWVSGKYKLHWFNWGNPERYRICFAVFKIWHFVLEHRTLISPEATKQRGCRATPHYLLCDSQSPRETKLKRLVVPVVERPVARRKFQPTSAVRMQNNPIAVGTENVLPSNRDAVCR
jgi:hypothetical protein